MDRMMTTRECAEFLRLSTKEIRALVRSGRLPCMMINSRTWRFHRETILQALISPRPANAS